MGPKEQGVTMSHRDDYRACIEACVRCAEECEHCATACLGEIDVAKLALCIRLDRDCATICETAAAFMSRGSQFAMDLCRVCAEICEACAAECHHHPMPHCQACAAACDHCAEECKRMAGVAA